MKYLTLGYTDGMIIEDRGSGAVSGTSVTFSATTPGEFNDGRFVAWVASGDGQFFYNQSAKAYYEYGASSSITDVIGESGISVTASEGYVGLDGL